jgi:hypothetical protein
MKTFAVNRCALSLGAAAALLAGCNVSQPLIGAPNVISAAQLHHQTFDYTGKEQTFKVPAGVKLITVDARGAAGGGNYSGHQGGLGGLITAELPVTPGENLAVFVGGSTDGASGGYNGGGEGRSFMFSGYTFTSYGGGGATDIRESGAALKDRILVAGGGGGLGGDGTLSGGGFGGDGGLGGGRVAGNGANGAGTKGRNHGRLYHNCYFYGGGGGGGTQHDGGKGGRKSCIEPGGTAGAFGDGGSGAEGSSEAGGGGGGGGYYGGGGGGAGTNRQSLPWLGSSGGGGGGSSYAEPRATSVHMRRGWKNATSNGVVVISW